MTAHRRLMPTATQRAATPSLHSLFSRTEAPTMNRVFNFSAGPAALPLPVLQQAAEGLADWRGAGCGVMEMSHRGAVFSQIIADTEADLRALTGLPENYKVLFLQGGATLQFSQIPMNLLGGGSADYLVNGTWSKKAYTEAARLAPYLGGEARLAGEANGSLVARDAMRLNPQARYVHLCTNETIHGIELLDEAHLPDCGDVPLVADMSSHILSRPMDFTRYGLVYAGAQKNIGPSGLTLVLIREDLLGRAAPLTPPVMDYATQAANGSMLNTPPTFAIHIAGLVLRWLREQGGLAAIAERNAQKAAMLYAAIDGSGGFYRNDVPAHCRSRMNVPFFLHDDALTADFLTGAQQRGLQQLKGHKSVGGLRASIYNAVPPEAVAALVDYMQDFARRHG